MDELSIIRKITFSGRGKANVTDPLALRFRHRVQPADEFGENLEIKLGNDRVGKYGTTRHYDRTNGKADCVVQFKTRITSKETCDRNEHFIINCW